MVAAAGILALGSCGSPIPPEEAGTPVAVAALPHPKPGLWAWNSEAGGRKQLCLSGRAVGAFTARPGCAETRQIRTAAGAYVVEASCRAGPVGRTWARSSGDYVRAFSVDLAIEDSRGGVTDHQDFRYLGPCAQGQHPDDAP
jgi:hypothetical protein